MKLSTWPAPPCHRGSEAPEIPAKIGMFGVQYSVADGHPALDMPAAPLDKEYVRRAVLKSYGTFLKLVATFDPVHLNELRDIHVEINEALNKAVTFQGDFAMQEAAEDQVALKTELYLKIRQAMNK